LDSGFSSGWLINNLFFRCAGRVLIFKALVASNHREEHKS